MFISWASFVKMIDWWWLRGCSVKLCEFVSIRAINFRSRTPDSVAWGPLSSNSHLGRLAGDSCLCQRHTPLFPLGYRNYRYTVYEDWASGCSGVLHGHRRTVSLDHGPLSHTSSARADAVVTGKISGGRSVSVDPASHLLKPLLVDWWFSTRLRGIQGFPWNPGLTGYRGYWRKVRRVPKASPSLREDLWTIQS